MTRATETPRHILTALETGCPRCKAGPLEACRTPKFRPTRIHEARYYTPVEKVEGDHGTYIDVLGGDDERLVQLLRTVYWMGFQYGMDSGGWA